ncbi:hypothetical protein M422DRAFT_220165 [Sphaerobolus stellatus SS14]|nr:hypothetical protein M422DRAFT_220165 [Sphaerobolus stellatus SS14]
MADIEPKDLETAAEKTRQSSDDIPEVVPQDDDTCSPLPEDVGKGSKKRLREVSVEVPSPKAEKDSADIDTKETEGPPKKNRLKTAEGDDGEMGEDSRPVTPSSTSPILSTSPRHDSKVRQIRRRVKDLSWKEGRRKAAETTEPVAGATDLQDDDVEVISDGKQDEDDSSKSVSVKSDSEKEENGPKDTTHAKTASGSDMDAEPSVSTSEVTSGRLSPDTGNCQGKRRRDDTDQNPRETKRVTPPPDQEKLEVKDVQVTTETVSPTKPSGFLAYSNNVSPFAAASGPNIFGASTSKPTFGSHTVPKVALSGAFSSPAAAKPSVNTASTPAFGGFGKYASTASPFAAAKPTGASSFGTPVASTSKSSGSKSPTRSKSPGRHFEPYTKGSGKFSAVPTRPSKKVRRTTADKGELGTGSASASENGDEDVEEEQEKPTSFSDILSAKDTDAGYLSEEEKKKVKLTEQEVMTGEEDEDTEFQLRAKLFKLVQGNWQERGVGVLKLNTHKDTGRARLVLRTDGVLRLVLNTFLFAGMDFQLGQDPRYVRFVIFEEDDHPVSWMLRFANNKNADEFLSRVKPYVPSPGATPQPEENV